jgi:hypothetical protein
MDYQGGRRSRPAGDARQAPWPPADDPGPGQLTGPGTGGYRVLGPGTGPLGPGTGPQPVLRPGTGPQPVLRPGTGPQPVLRPGSGPQQVLRPGSGPQRVLGSGSGPQPTLDRTPVRGFPPPASGYQPPPTPPQGFPAADDDDPVPPASIARRPEPTPEPEPGRRAARSARPRRRSARAAWLVLAVVLIIAAGAGAGYKFLYEPRVNAPVPASLRLPTYAPGSPGVDHAVAGWQHIGTRAQDPQPLTLQALFPPQFELNGSSYVRTAADVSKNCTLAVFGANLQAALQSGHCTQVLRASYISGNGTMMGTVGVANLISSSAAQQAGQTTGPQEIIAPLAAQKGPTSKLGNGTGVVQAEIKGHYLILMWAEFTSLKSPSTSAQRQQLEQFAANLVTGSANINLSTRMLTGKQ